MKKYNDIDLSFHVEKKVIQNLKYFVLKDQQYPIDFDLLKKNSQYFYRNRKQFHNINKIFLLNDAEESLIDISDGAVRSFISSCSNEPCKIHLSDVISLQYLSNKFEFQELITITNKFYEDHSDSLVLPSLLLKLKVRPNNQRKNIQNEKIDFYLNTDKEEEIISSHLTEYIKKDEMFLLPISSLDQIFQQFFSNSKSRIIMKKNSAEFIEFLFKCLDKHGIDASILFSYVDFENQSIGIVNRLIKDYSDKFDFNMINSTLLKTTTQLTSEVTRLKEECSLVLSQMKQQFNEQQTELMKIKKEEIEREKEFNEKLKIVLENDERRSKERENIFKKQINFMEKNYEETIQKIKLEEVEREREREKIFQEEMKKLKMEQEKFEEQMKSLNDKEEEKSKEREKIFQDEMKKLKMEQEKLEEQIKSLNDKEEEKSKEREMIFQDQLKKMKRKKTKKILKKKSKTKVKSNDTEKRNLNEIDDDDDDENSEEDKSENDDVDYDEQKEDKKVNENQIKSLHSDIQQPFEIFVKIYSGKTIVFKVLPNDTIEHLKQLIEDKEGIPIEKQLLISSGKPLFNGNTIQFYSIQRNSTIHLNIRINALSKICIILANDEKIMLDYHPNDYISSIKEIIEQKTGIPSNNQQLVYNGRELDDELTLEDSSIFSGYQLNLVSSINIQKIYIQKADGSKITIQYLNIDQIKDIKDKIRKIEKCSSQKLVLLYNGRILKDDKTLDELNINKESILKLVILKK